MRQVRTGTDSPATRAGGARADAPRPRASRREGDDARGVAAAVSPWLWRAEALAARVRSLIAQRDGGDVCAAARRLGVPVTRLVRLEETFSADTRRAEMRVAADEILIGAIQHYGVSAAWLVTGCDEPDLAALPARARERLVYVLVAAAERTAARFIGAAVSAPSSPPPALPAHRASSAPH